MVNNRKIILAAPQPRFDVLERALVEHYEINVVRFRKVGDLTPERLAALEPRYIFFPHWSWKIPASIYDNYECVIFHMTDLPFGRGGSPLQNLIVRGFKDTQLTALRCVEELDSGPIYLKRPLSLEGSAERIFARAAKLMEEMIDTILKQEPQPEPQTGTVVWFERRTPKQSNLSAVTSLQLTYDMIRMLDANGYPSAFLELDDMRLEFSNAKIYEDYVHAEVRITISKKGAQE